MPTPSATTPRPVNAARLFHLFHLFHLFQTHSHAKWNTHPSLATHRQNALFVPAKK